MNSLFKLLILLLITVLILPSCNSGLSITKRRYQKGFYVNNSGRHIDVKSKALAKNNPKQKQTFVSEEHLQALSASMTQREDLRLLASAGTESKPASAQLSGNAATMIPAELMISNPVKTIRNLKERINADPARSEALSLLWILILVLLAAYIAGLLLDSFGLGWVIHVLLVVILVLLILWLLRIL